MACLRSARNLVLIGARCGTQPLSRSGRDGSLAKCGMVSQCSRHLAVGPMQLLPRSLQQKQQPHAQAGPCSLTVATLNITNGRVSGDPSLARATALGTRAALYARGNLDLTLCKVVSCKLLRVCHSKLLYLGVQQNSSPCRVFRLPRRWAHTPGVAERRNLRAKILHTLWVFDRFF